MSKKSDTVKGLKTTLLLLLCFSSYSFGGSINLEISTSKQIVARFNATLDTAGLSNALTVINENFIQSRDSKLLPLLLQVSEREARLDKRTLKNLYFILRKFYDIENTKTKNFEYSLKIYKILSQTNDYEGLMWILIDIGNIFYSEKDYEQAGSFYQKAEKAALKVQSNYALSIIYLNYGMIAESAKAYPRSLDNYRTSSEYRLKSGNVKVVSGTYIKMALIQLHLSRPDSCLYYIHLAEHYYYREGTATPLVKDVPFHINYVYAEYFLRKNNFDKAIAYIRKAEKYSRDNNLIGEMIAGNTYESSFLFKAGKYKDAIATVQELLPMYKRYGLLAQQKYVYRMLKNCYSALGQYKQANAASKHYVVIDDSIHKYSIRSELNMIRSIAAVYESESKLNQTRKNLQIENFNNRIRIKQRNASGMIAVFSLLGVVILVGLFINSRKNKQRLLSLHNQLMYKNNEAKVNSLALKRSNQLKDNLFSIISNDLRNPLYRLLDELLIVKEAIEEKQITAPIESTLQETISLFEGLLEWSRTGEKQNIFSPVRVNLDENINKIILFYLPEIQAREIKIINKSLAMATFADQNIVQTLLRNLLGNAIAAVSKNGINGMIEIDTSLREDGQIEILVSDSGPGFPQEILEKFRDEKFDVNAKSQGLGLSICKALSRMSGWKMELGNGGHFNGAVVRILVPHFKEPLVPETVEIHKHLPVVARTQFAPLKAFRFYQTSEIRLFVKGLDETADPAAQEWIRLIEKSVHDGDQKAYEELIDLI